MMAEEYSRDLSKKISSASQRSISSGVAYGNGRIYGYDKIPKSYVINEEEAVIVRQVFNWYIEGYGFRTIQKMLTERGIFSSTGTQFSLSTLKRMIKNEKYKGLLVSGKTRYNFETKKTELVAKDQRTYIEDGIPAIVTEDIWERANEIIRRKAKQYDDNRTRGMSTNYFAPEQSALSGKIICAKCGKVFWHNPYTTKVNKLRRDIWVCSTYKSWGVKYCKNHNIEYNKILDKVKEILFLENKNCESVKATIEILRQSLDEGREQRVNSISSQIEKYNNRLNRLTDLVLDGMINKDEFLSKKSEIISKIDSLQTTLNNEKKQQESFLSKEQRLKEIKKFLETTITTESDITDNDIRKFVKKITVADEIVTVETSSGNEYSINPDDVIIHFMPRNKNFLAKLHQGANAPKIDNI